MGHHVKTVFAEFRADVAGGALVGRDARELVHQLGVVGRVDFGAWPAHAGVAGADHARRAAEVIDLDAAVVGEADAVGELGVVPGLERGVALEGVLVFDGVGDAVVVLVFNRVEQRPGDRVVFDFVVKHRPDFFELVRVGGGENDLHNVSGSGQGGWGSRLY